MLRRIMDWLNGEPYTWHAEYPDGTTVSESDVGTFAAVDTTRCTAVVLEPKRTGLRSVRVLIDPAKGQRAVCFRRRLIAVDPSGQRPNRHERVATVAGWESEQGCGYAFALDDGRVIMTSERNAL